MISDFRNEIKSLIRIFLLHGHRWCKKNLSPKPEVSVLYVSLYRVYSVWCEIIPSRLSEVFTFLFDVCLIGENIVYSHIKCYKSEHNRWKRLRLGLILSNSKRSSLFLFSACLDLSSGERNKLSMDGDVPWYLIMPVLSLCFPDFPWLRFVVVNSELSSSKESSFLAMV